MIRAEVTLQELQELGKGTLAHHMEIEFTAIGADFLIAKMPINNKTIQPLGLLHGGASVALAETLGSVAAHCCIDPALQICVGLEINANHIRSAKNGFVYGKATPLHIGRTTHVWEIKITDEQEKLICVSRITMAILEKNKG